MANAPVGKLKKKEIVWLGNHKCKHGHTYLEHYSCFTSEIASKHEWEPGSNIPIPHRIGYFDIESTGFQADFSIMLCYCIKDSMSDKIYGRCINRKEMQKDLDYNIVKSCIEDLKKFDRVVTYYGCVIPEHRVLTSSLEWKQVGNIKTGDLLLAFNEDGPRRKWEISSVKHNIPLEKECVRLFLDDGTELDCSIDHPWLCNENMYWLTPTNMNKMTRGESSFSKMRKLMDVWNYNPSYNSGYLAGCFDGEGTIKQSNSLSLMLAQKDNSLLTNVSTFLKELGFDFYIGKREGDMRHLLLRGGLQKNLELLGTIKPKRLFDLLDLPKLNNQEMISNLPFRKIKRIENIGKRIVMGLETSSATYIVEGYGSHNTGFDLPFLRTRALYHNLDFPGYSELLHTDAYYIVRNKFKLSRSRQGTASNILVGEARKTQYGRDQWTKALTGDKVSLGYIYDHCQKDTQDLEDLYNKIQKFSMRSDKSI